MSDGRDPMGRRTGERVGKLNSPVLSPQESSGCLASSTGLMRVGAANSRETNPDLTSEAICETREKNDLGFSAVGSVASTSIRDEKKSETRQVETVTFDQSTRLESEISGVFPEYILRPAELVRLLNSTPLGVVTNDRQIYRNRQKAPRIMVDGKYVCLIKYCAWMVLERHSRKGNRRSKQRRVSGDCIKLGELRALLHRQQYKCALSGTELTPTNIALDHIVPVAMGGAFSIDNCQLVTKEINRAKHTMSQDDFLQMCNNVCRHQVALTAQKKEKPTDKNRHLLGLMS